MKHPIGRRLLAFAALLSLSAACGGGAGEPYTDGGGTPPTPGPETVELYCDALYDTFASRYAACSKAPLAWATNVIDKVELCTGVARAVNQGKGTYDRDASGRCLAFFESATCTDLRAIRDDVKYVADCQAAVVGIGSSSCVSDDECASGRCYSRSCPGVCYNGATAGQACSLDRDCAPGLYCFMGAPYSGSTCQPHDGRPDVDQTCTIATGCKPGLYCDGSVHSSDPGTCKAQISAGTCPGVKVAMAPGFGCYGGVTQPLLGPGEACSRATDYCGPGLYCGASSICVELPSVGSDCVMAQGTWKCLGGSCYVESLYRATCQEFYPTTCYSDWDCESMGVCDGGCQYFCF